MSWFGSSLAINVATGSTFAGIGRFGGSSFRSLSFFFNRSIYCHTLLVLAVSCITKNYGSQLNGLLRIRLILDEDLLILVIIFKILTV